MRRLESAHPTFSRGSGRSLDPPVMNCPCETRGTVQAVKDLDHRSISSEAVVPMSSLASQFDRARSMGSRDVAHRAGYLALNTSGSGDVHMGYALTALFVVVSLLSCFFIVGKYRTATPVQRRQIVFGGFGAAALAIAMGTLIYFR